MIVLCVDNMASLQTAGYFFPKVRLTRFSIIWSLVVMWPASGAQESNSNVCSALMRGSPCCKNDYIN